MPVGEARWGRAWGRKSGDERMGEGVGWRRAGTGAALVFPRHCPVGFRQCHLVRVRPPRVGGAVYDGIINYSKPRAWGRGSTIRHGNVPCALVRPSWMPLEMCAMCHSTAAEAPVVDMKESSSAGRGAEPPEWRRLRAVPHNCPEGKSMSVARKSATHASHHMPHPVLLPLLEHRPTVSLSAPTQAGGAPSAQRPDDTETGGRAPQLGGGGIPSYEVRWASWAPLT